MAPALSARPGPSLFLRSIDHHPAVTFKSRALKARLLSFSLSQRVAWCFAQLSLTSDWKFCREMFMLVGEERLQG